VRVTLPRDVANHGDLQPADDGNGVKINRSFCDAGHSTGPANCEMVKLCIVLDRQNLGAASPTNAAIASPARDEGRSMESPAVRYFLALCEEKHFGAAAKRCGISQPTLTNAIRRLEDLAGAPLFMRGPPAQLTPLALAIKPYFEQIAQAAEHARDEIAKARKAECGNDGR
jgi:hypothetical protein